VRTFSNHAIQKKKKKTPTQSHNQDDLGSGKGREATLEGNIAALEREQKGRRSSE
jgi:hypothetical protein